MLLAHGDLAERRGSSRLLRWFLRSPLFRLINRLVPPTIQLEGCHEAFRIRAGARSSGEEPIARFMKEYARKRIGEGFDLVVMGHTHIAAISHETVNGRRGIYANLR